MIFTGEMRSVVLGTAGCFLLYAAVPGYGQDVISLDADRSDGGEQATWRFELYNDRVFRKDNQITSGWSLQNHSAVAGSWDGLEEVPGFVKNLGQKIPTLTKEGLVCRAGIVIGQTIQTPDDLSRSDLIEDDVPYAGSLTLQATWYVFNDEEFRGFGITAGVVGPPSLAREVQNVAHHLTGSTDPQGWDNQLDTEPVINLNYTRKYKIWQGGNPAAFSGDTALNANVGLGNLLTQAGTALEMRFGYNIPQGFGYVPDPIGLSVHHMATLKPRDSRIGSFYATLVLSGSAFVHNIFLDGNMFRDSHGVDKKPLVAVAVAGLHYEKENWGVHFSVMASSDNVDTGKAPAAEGRERLGTIDIEWRF